MDPFYETVRRAEEAWYERKRQLDESERLVLKEPSAWRLPLFEESLYWWRIWRRRCRRLKARGKKRRVIREDGGQSVRYSLRSPEEFFSFLCAETEFVLWETTLWAMLEASRCATEAGRDPYLAACRGYFAAQRFLIDMVAILFKPDTALPRPEQLRHPGQLYLAAVLTGGVAAQLSLRRNLQLRKAMGDGEDYRTARALRERLLQELPGTIACEWEEPPGRYILLRNRVDRALIYLDDPNLVGLGVW